MKKMTMRTRNVLVSFLAIAYVLVLIANISAITPDLAVIESVEIKGITELGSEDISVKAGETIDIVIVFEALADTSDVRLKAELEGTKIDVDKEILIGDVELGKRYTASLTLQIPFELEDELSDDLSLNIKIWNSDFRTEHPEVILRVQRLAYNVGVMSINSDSTMTAGELFPVDVVLKNTGYNKLDNLYVTVSVPALEVAKTVYFGDIEALETVDEDDTVRGRVFLQVPFDSEPGIYVLQVDVRNADLSKTAVKEILIENDFVSNLVISDNGKNVAVGQDAVYEVLVVNPTNSLKAYRLVFESPSSVSVTSSETVVAVPAGSSKVVEVTASADSEGEYDIEVNVFSGEKLVETVSLSLDAEGNVIASPVVALTIILAIIFVVLLGVLVVLITKKPNKKSEEIGESYY